MKDNILNSKNIKKIHFIGIGGISMSGLAEILFDLGYIVSGSDENKSSITDKLQSKGIDVFIGHNPQNIKNPDLVVYTAAVKDDNPELEKARALGIKTIDRATLLGEIMKKYPYSIGVSGTHGKTTTTSMISLIMLEAGLDPTIHIGGELDYICGTTKTGNSDYFVTEACEYKDSFLKFYPYIAVILNIDLDHVDYFKDIEQIMDSFVNYASHVKEGGCVIACGDDGNVLSILDRISAPVIIYGLNNKNCTWSAKDISFDASGYSSFTVLKDGREMETIKLYVPGIHNVYNSLAAIATCYRLGCSMAAIKKGLNKFTGTHRRFEEKGIFKGVKIIDDYAHHPSEIKATLKAAKSRGFSKIWCIFQPHTYTRTKSFLKDFASSFNDADTVIVTDIYAAREKDTGEIHSRILAEEINCVSGNAIYMSDFQSIANYIKDNVSTGDVVITMGAGDVYKVGDILLKENLANKKSYC
ncbi:MAG TPA: UDP-N-acetylmuramate--L-alanine ligase [Clostridiaceae bacterium]|nr:UDP-N-acetylmuramate--L-alanine ligase [Clostridiaceae bacterium]